MYDIFVSSCTCSSEGAVNNACSVWCFTICITSTCFLKQDQRNSVSDLLHILHIRRASKWKPQNQFTSCSFRNTFCVPKGKEKQKCKYGGIFNPVAAVANYHGKEIVVSSDPCSQTLRVRSKRQLPQKIKVSVTLHVLLCNQSVACLRVISADFIYPLSEGV